VAATGAIVQDAVAAYDGVRPGLSIYGLLPYELHGALRPAVEGAFRPAMSLHARPVRVADLPTGWGISYGPTFRTARPSRIATLPLGYGDGWPRALSNRATAIVRGRRVPLVGNVAMDAVMADVTDVPGPPVTVDDEYVLMGRPLDAEITTSEVASNVGYLVFAAHWGKGIASEAVGALSDHLAQAGIREQHATVTVGNQASCRVLEKCGFERSAVLPANDVIRGVSYDDYAYVRRG
jgi:alanine racemase